MADSEFTVKSIQPKDKQAVMDFLKSTFFVDEPLNKSVGLCDEGPDSCPELEEYCKSSLSEDISVMAIDSEGNIIGVMVNGISCLREVNNPNGISRLADMCKNSKFQKILQIIARTEETVNLPQHFPNDEYLMDVKVVATDKNWRRRGVMTALVKETEDLANNKNIKVLRMDTSSAFSAMAAEKCGFTCIYKVPFADIRSGGRPLILPEPPHLYYCVYVKRLASEQ